MHLYSRQLDDLHRYIKRRIYRIREIHAETSRSGIPKDTVANSYVVIELDNLIVSSNRCFLISSLIGTITMNNTHISCGAPIDSIHHAALAVLH